MTDSNQHSEHAPIVSWTTREFEGRQWVTATRYEELVEMHADLVEQLEAAREDAYREHQAVEGWSLKAERLQEQYGTLRDAAQGLVSHLSLREPMQFKEQEGCDAWNSLLDALGEVSSPATSLEDGEHSDG